MSLPPVVLHPSLARLLLPGEVPVYSVLWHPLRGWPWLVSGCLLLLVSLRMILLLPIGLGLLWRWNLPRVTNAVMITDRRLLMRLGDFRLRTETVEREQIVAWRVRQNLLMVLLHVGTVEIDVRAGNGLVQETLHWVWHPLTLAEALEAMQQGPKDVGRGRA